MAETLEQLLDAADQAWSRGELIRARELYGRAHERDATCWHAAFQGIWIDAAIGRVDEGQLAALDRADLSDRARTLIEMVRHRAGRAAGHPELAAWDVSRLRERDGASSHGWWEAIADRAFEAGQWGLALACFDQAETLAPGLHHDPPRRAQLLPGRLAGHLKTVRSVPR